MSDNEIAFKVGVIREDILGAAKLAKDIELPHLASTLYFLAVAMQSKRAANAIREICDATYGVMQNYRDG